MDLSMSSREDPFAPDSIFSQQDLPVVPNDNPESYCRLCLTTPEVVPLFPTDSDPNEFILELIGKYIGIGLTIQDDAPCSVCNSCQMILDQFDLFRQNCLKVDIAIRRRRLGLDRVVKNEPLDEEDGEEVELPYIRLENRVYKCRLCSDKFRSMALFMAHCKEEHPDEAKMYKCKHCSKSFMSKTARLQHIRSHRPSNSEGDFGGIRVQVCERCMVTFDSYKLLKIHIKDNHSNEPKQDSLVCNTCARQFSRITILRNHILRVHMGRLPHVCKQCGVSYGYIQQLVSHLKTEHGINPDQYGLYPEDDADPEETTHLVPFVPLPASPDPVELLEDIKPPLVEEPTPDDSNRKPLNKYTCMECRVQCYSQEELRTHRKIHQDPTWWKCTHCRNFVKHREMHLLKKHPTISASEMETSFTLRYRCWMCRMYFKSLHQMEVHANIKHQVPLPDHHHQEAAPSDELEEGEIRSDVPMSTGAMLPPGMALPGMRQPLTAQPPLPITAENFPLLLSQLENGALDYLREFSRLIDPNNQLGMAGQLNIKSEPVDTSHSAMDLSGNSALNMTVGSTATDLQTSAAEHDEEPDGDDESEDDTFFRLDNRTYQCKFCPEIFRHLQQIRKHTKVQHPSEWKSFKCVHCKRRFPSSPMRDRHVHFHSLNHPFKCNACDQMYRSKKRLDKHYEMFHNRNSPSFSMERFHCGACELTFVEKKYYDLHSRIYHERKPQRLKNLSDKIQVCERCVKTFASRDLLMEHIRETHQGDPPLKNCICQTCSKDLKTVTLLRIHILVVHMGIMPFVCQHCSAEFSTRHWLLKHLEKEHSEIALFKCPACDESFTTEARMSEHKDKVHAQPEVEFDPQSGKRVYPCGKCEKKFETKDLMEKHLLKAHPSFMLMYKCPLCTQNVRYRKQHMRVHHDAEYDDKEHSYQIRYKCHCCSKLFQQKRNLLSHQNSLANQCGRCQMRFKTKKNLQAHMATHRANNSLKCEDCGLDFGYRGRLEEHRKRYHSPSSTQVLKIINCPYCPKLFISPSNRERHIAANHVQSEFNVNCGHCPVQTTDISHLRKHYKTEHPEERVTFKCPWCEKFYLNLSSFKDHHRKHKGGEAGQIKQEPLDIGESAVGNNSDGEGKSSPEEGPSDHTSEQTVKTEQPEASMEQQPAVEEPSEEEKPDLLGAKELEQDEGMLVEKPENLDDPKVEESMEVDETIQLATNESTAVAQPEQNIPQESISVEGDKPTVEEPQADEKMEIDQKSTSELPPQQEISSDHDVSPPDSKPMEEIKLETDSDVQKTEESESLEKTVAEDATVNEAIDSKPNEEAAPQNEAPKSELATLLAKQATPVECEIVDNSVEEVGPEQKIEPQSESPEESEPATAQAEQVTAKKEEEVTNESAEEVGPEHEITPESESPEELKSESPQTVPPEEQVPIEEETAEQAHSESESPEELKSELPQTVQPEEQVPIEEETAEQEHSESEPKQPLQAEEQQLNSEPVTAQELLKPEELVSESDTAEVEPEQVIAVESIVLDENPSVSDAPLVESCSSKNEEEEGVVNDERVVQQQDETDKEKGDEPAEPVAPEHSKSKPEDADGKEKSSRDKTLQEDAASESGKSYLATQRQKRTVESPLAVKRSQEPPTDSSASSMQNSNDDPSPEELRSINNSPTSTLVESPYTIVETSNEASEVSESSERSSKVKMSEERRRISTRNILKRKKQLVVLLEPVDIDKLMELSRGSSSSMSSSPSLERVAMRGSAGSSSESQPAAEDGVRAKRLRRERRTPNSDPVAGDS